MAPSAALFVPSTPVDLPLGATSFTLPVNLNPAAGSLSSAAFSLDYDTACLSINPADSNGDGIPEAISGLPGGFVNSVMLDTADTRRRAGRGDVGCDAAPGCAARRRHPQDQVRHSARLPGTGGPEHLCEVLLCPGRHLQRQSTATPSTAARRAPTRCCWTTTSAPTAITLTPSSVAENAPVGTTVGTLSVTDPDGDAPVYTLSSACSGSFANSDFTLSGSTL